MTIELIAIIVFVGLVGYLLGRRAGRRRDADGRMLQTPEPRTLDAARSAAAIAQTRALDADSLAEIKQLLAKRQLIGAIKVYRERTNCGLREAKDAVEAIMKSL